MNNNQFMWQDRFNIGVEVIDREHKKLFGILKKLLTFSKDAEKNSGCVRRELNIFKDMP